MTREAVVICSHLYTYENDNWEAKLADIASDIENNWNDQIATSRSDEISVDSPPLPSGDGVLNSPGSRQSPAEYRDGYRAIINVGTNLFETYDTVLVMTAVDKGSIGGIAYLGEPRYQDRPGDFEGQAAGTSYGLGVLFDPNHPSRAAYHEMLHTFSAIHQHGDRDYSYWYGEDCTVMSQNVEGCDGGDNNFATKMNPSNCAEGAVNDYLNSWF